MSKFLRMPPTRERRVNRMKTELIGDMLAALKLAYPRLDAKRITVDQRRYIAGVITRAERETIYDRPI